MFDDYIRKQSSDEYVIRAAISVEGRNRRVEARQAFATATRVILRVMVMVVHGTLLFNGQFLLHANHTVGMVMVGNNGCHQHDNVD